MKRRSSVVRLAFSGVTAVLLAAQCGATAPDAAETGLLPASAARADTVLIGGKVISYRSDIAEMLLRRVDGSPQATMSATSYLAQGTDPAVRPVTFLFNGGPLSATIALRRGIAPDIAGAGPQRGTFTFTSNTDSLIDVTDLVFIDAAGTGYGRVLSEDAKAEIWGVRQDADAFARFIADWLEKHGRTRSPLFLMGESYGGTRAGFLSAALAQQGLAPKGVILISPTVAAGGDSPIGTGDPDAMALPTRAAIARFHGRGAYRALSLSQVTDRAATFARQTYAPALTRLSRLSPGERRRIAQRVADLTGIAVDQIDANGLRIPDFGDALLAGERLGRDDARLHAPIDEVKQLPPPYDEPGSSLVRGTFDQAAAYDSLYRFGYGYRPKGAFVSLSLEANRRWNYTVPGGVADIPTMFHDQMLTNPDLRVLVVAGYFDTTVPYLFPMAAYQAASLPPGRFSFQLLEAGHAVFDDPAARARAASLVRAFIVSSDRITPRR